MEVSYDQQMKTVNEIIHRYQTEKLEAFDTETALNNIFASIGLISHNYQMLVKNGEHYRDLVVSVHNGSQQELPKENAFAKMLDQRRENDIHQQGLYMNAISDMEAIVQVLDILNLMINTKKQPNVEKIEEEVKHEKVETQINDDKEDYCLIDPRCNLCWNHRDLEINGDKFAANYCMFKCLHCKHVKEFRLKNLHYNENDIIPTNDKYYEVTLYSEEEDGSLVHITNELIKNFKHMFPKSYPAKAFVYSIEKTSAPTLHGLIRYDQKGEYNISPKSSHIKNVIPSESTKTRKLRMLEVINKTKYTNRRFATNQQSIVIAYQKIMSKGYVMGDSLEQIIAPD